MTVIPLGILIASKLEQPQKTILSISVIESF